MAKEAEALGLVDVKERFVDGLFAPKKKGGVGKTKRDKATKLLVTVEKRGLPVALSAHSATPHEVTLVEEMLRQRWTPLALERLVGDKAYDSDGLDERLAQQGIRLIAHNRARRRRTQDGRELHRYRRSWLVERLWAWLQIFRRIAVRHEYRVENYLALCQLGCAILFMRGSLFGV